jgi:acid phosphatase
LVQETCACANAGVCSITGVLVMKRSLLVRCLTFAAIGTGAIGVVSADGPESDPLARIQRIVVIYQENHSFDNLYGGWEGVDGLASPPTSRTAQVNQNGERFDCLMQNDVTLAATSKGPLCTDPTGFSSRFTNAPFTIDDYIGPELENCPYGTLPADHPVAGGCTKDLVHRFYQEQYQLNGGRQNRYVTGSDSVGLTMGTYNTQLLPIYRYLHVTGHPRYAILDNFFQAAFGGSFLNHQWLIAARTPVWPNAVTDRSNADLHSIIDVNGMPTNYPLYASPQTGLKDQQLTAKCDQPNLPPGLLCGDYAVNTIQPTYLPFTPGTSLTKRLPPQTAATIGDRLSEKNIDWAWYSGGWSNANGDIDAPGWTNGAGPLCSDPNTNPAANTLGTFPNCPDKLFQFHHQAFNFYAAYAPGTDARRQHLRDEFEFLTLAKDSTDRCKLKPVSFVKPVGAENEHPGYASEHNGSDHLVDLLTAVNNSRCAEGTLVIVTYDEFGGTWDHVTPPGQRGRPGAHDQHRPGTRIPALIISPLLRNEFVVDRTRYDTTSILATIERRFGLASLSSRDAAVNDRSNVFDAKSPFDDEREDR